MKFAIASAVLVLACASTAAWAEPTKPLPASLTAQPAKATDPDRIICRDDAITGQRITTRTCRTRREWDAMSDRGKKFTEQIQEHSTSGCLGAAC